MNNAIVSEVSAGSTVVDIFECPICQAMHASENAVAACYSSCAQTRANTMFNAWKKSWESELPTALLEYTEQVRKGTTSVSFESIVFQLNVFLNKVSAPFTMRLKSAQLKPFREKMSLEAVSNNISYVEYKIELEVSPVLLRMWTSPSWKLQESSGLGALKCFPYFDELGAVSRKEVKCTIPFYTMLKKWFEFFSIDMTSLSLVQDATSGLLQLPMSCRVPSKSTIFKKTMQDIASCVQEWNKDLESLSEVELSLKKRVDHILKHSLKVDRLSDLDLKIRQLEQELNKIKSERKDILCAVAKELEPLENDACQEASVILQKTYAKLVKLNIRVDSPKPPAVGYGMLKEYVRYSPALLKLAV